MVRVIGRATVSSGVKQAMLAEALQDALNKAPGPGPHNDTQHFHVVSIDLEFGGIVGATTTQITVDVENGPLPRAD